MSSIQPALAPRTPLASPEEYLRDRIRRFSNFWRGEIGHALVEPASIDVQLEVLPAHEARYYGFTHAYNVSGWSERVYYPDRERGTSSVGGRHEITSDWVPKAIVQCAPPPGQVAGEATLRMWEQVEAAQAHPTWTRSIPTIEDGVETIEMEPPVDLATQVCFPRCIEFQTAFRRQAGAAPNMSAWVAAPQLAIEPQPGSAGHGCRELWTQIRGCQDLEQDLDERRHGSPRSPLLSALRMDTTRDGRSLGSALVIFRIVREGVNSFRPWRIGDVAQPRLWTPLSHPLFLHPSIQPSPSTQVPVTDPDRYQRFKIPPSHSLSHRQRVIYNQKDEIARTGSF